MLNCRFTFTLENGYYFDKHSLRFRRQSRFFRIYRRIKIFEDEKGKNYVNVNCKHWSEIMNIRNQVKFQYG